MNLKEATEYAAASWPKETAITLTGSEWAALGVMLNAAIAAGCPWPSAQSALTKILAHHVAIQAEEWPEKIGEQR